MEDTQLSIDKRQELSPEKSAPSLSNGSESGGEIGPSVEEAEKLIKDFNFDENHQKSRDELAGSIQSDHDSSIVKATETVERFVFSEAKKQIIVDRLHRASDFVEVGDLESAL
jgi:hypothetical protein